MSPLHGNSSFCISTEIEISHCLCAHHVLVSGLGLEGCEGNVFIKNLSKYARRYIQRRSHCVLLPPAHEKIAKIIFSLLCIFARGFAQQVLLIGV